MMSITQPRSIPAGSRPCADDRARVLRHPYTAMKEPAWASRMPLAPGGHAAAACPDPGPSAAWRDEPAARRAGRRPAGWPDPETVPEPVDASDRQRRAGPSLAAKKADAAVNIPFTRPNRAASAREPLNSAIASPADCLVSAATAAPVLSLQRRSVYVQWF